MTEKRTIVFLDIDGVLNDQDWVSAVIADYEARGTEPDGPIAALAAIIDPDRVALLNAIVRDGRAEVVAATSWREVLDIEELTDALQRKGFDHEIVDMTPIEPEGRGRQIAAWLDGRDDVGAVAILDDDVDMDPVTEHWVQTDNTVGLTDAHVRAALEMLGRG